MDLEEKLTGIEGRKECRVPSIPISQINDYGVIRVKNEGTLSKKENMDDNYYFSCVLYARIVTPLFIVAKRNIQHIQTL